MAMSNSYLDTLETDFDIVYRYLNNDKSHNGGFPDLLNTFTYVYNTCQNWGEGTPVGSELLEKLNATNQAIQAVYEQFNILHDNLTTYIEQQRAINNG